MRSQFAQWSSNAGNRTDGPRDESESFSQSRSTAGVSAFDGHNWGSGEARDRDPTFHRGSHPPESSGTMLTPANDPESTFTQRPVPPHVLEASIPEVSARQKIFIMHGINRILSSKTDSVLNSGKAGDPIPRFLDKEASEILATAHLTPQPICDHLFNTLSDSFNSSVVLSYLCCLIVPSISSVTIVSSEFLCTKAHIAGAIMAEHPSERSTTYVPLRSP